MAGNSKDSKILAYKDMINQLNKTISTQTELIQSLQKTLEADRLEKENLRQQMVNVAIFCAYITGLLTCYLAQ